MLMFTPDTTRSPRPAEVDGRDYHFVSRGDFEALQRAGAFIESVSYSGNYYGTSLDSIRSVQASGKTCVLDIDSQGVRLLRASAASFAVPPVFVYICPPSVDVLKERLRTRHTETDAECADRVRTASEEMAFAEGTPGVYDFKLVNDDLAASYAKFRQFVVIHILQH